MSERRPFHTEVHAGAQPPDDSAGVAAERFKEALARWASTVTVFAVRDPDDGKVYATTATSFAPVAAEPPLVVVSLGATAQALPFVEEGGPAGISLLAEDQKRWATTFADSFPVGPTPWDDDGTPLIDGAVARLHCTVQQVVPADGGSRLILCRVDDTDLGEDGEPLLYWQRDYRKLER